jgi:HK97 family phage major capsid protein
MSTKLTAAVRELRAVYQELDALTAGGRQLTKGEEARHSVLLSKAKALRDNPAIAVDDYAKRWFRALTSGVEIESRATIDSLQGGKLTPTYTQGPSGGYTVPTEFHDALVLGLAQVDPLLDPNLVTLMESDSLTLRPHVVPGWDLSDFEAHQVAEATQQTPQVVPTATAKQLNSYTFRAVLNASFEIENDDFQPVLNQFVKAYSVGFGRGIGKALINGNGTSAPQGVLVGATDSGVTTAASAGITADNIEDIFFSVNAIYRESPACAWLLNDATYKKLRKVQDLNKRPIISIVDGRALLMGKPVRICPSISATQGQPGIVFGDLSHYVVRISRAQIIRSVNTPSTAEYGVAQYTGLVRCDAKVVDPTSGSVPAIVYATLGSDPI